MFQISSVKTRHFEFEAPDNKKVLRIEPPKLKTLKRLEDMSKDQSSGVAGLAALVAQLLSKNTAQRRISADQVMDWMDMDQMKAFMREFTNWLKAERSNDPN